MGTLVSAAPRVDGHKVMFVFESHLTDDTAGTWSATCAQPDCSWTGEAVWTSGCDGVALAELVQAATAHEAEPAEQRV